MGERRVYWPGLIFADYAGPQKRTFAWLPVKLWNGRLAWMRHVWRRHAVVKAHLCPGGGDVFLMYSEETPNG